MRKLKSFLSDFHDAVREAFKKKHDGTYGKFHMLGGGLQGGHFPYVVTKDFYSILSHFKPF